MPNKKNKKSGKSLSELAMDVFREKPKQKLNYKQVAKAVGIHSASSKKKIQETLFKLVDKKMLKYEDKGKYSLNLQSISNFIGKVDMTASGAAYIISEDQEQDVFVSENNLGHALHGDTVKVRIIKAKKSGKLVGAISEIIEKGKREFVGIIEKSSKFAFLIPDDKKMPVDIFIPLEKLNAAEDGMKAIAKIHDWPLEADCPFGEIIQVLGKPGENETEMHSILAEYGLPSKFPEHVEKDAENLDTKIHESEVKKRRDFRKVATFTIDPADAKDFDDALSIQKLENGNWEIGVHIADVSFYLREDTELDKEAFERATSVYLVDRVVPMLPEVLSNFACSLRPDEDKYCFSAVFEMDENGRVHKEWFGRTIINSDKRFAYEDAQKIIEEGKGEFADEILTLDKIAKRLRAERFKKGSIDFHQLEVKFRLDENGEPTGVFLKEQKDANKLIEEFMLLANRKVAAFIGDRKKAEKAKPFVYRIHDNPDPEKLLQFSTFIRKFGYRIDVTSPKGITQTLNRLMSEVEGKVEEDLISQLAIRTMAKAIYSMENIGHYGLGFHYYTHFTSPIRRYPDVMVHRLLQHYLDGGKAVDEEELQEKCKHSSEREKLAVEAERASIKFMQVKFMQDRVGEVFAGIVSGVSEWGVFVELEDNKCEGMVRLKSMQDDFYVFDADNYCVIGKRHGKIYRIGEKVTVIVKRADLAKKQLDFEIVEEN